METRNVLFAVILSTIVLVFWATFFEAPIVEQKPTENQIIENQNSDSPSIDETKKEATSNVKKVEQISKELAHPK